MPELDHDRDRIAAARAHRDVLEGELAGKVGRRLDERVARYVRAALAALNLRGARIAIEGGQGRRGDVNEHAGYGIRNGPRRDPGRGALLQPGSHDSGQRRRGPAVAGDLLLTQAGARDVAAADVGAAAGTAELGRIARRTARADDAAAAVPRLAAIVSEARAGLGDAHRWGGAVRHDPAAKSRATAAAEL